MRTTTPPAWLEDWARDSYARGAYALRMGDDLRVAATTGTAAILLEGVDAAGLPELGEDAAGVLRQGFEQPVEGETVDLDAFRAWLGGVEWIHAEAPDEEPFLPLRPGWIGELAVNRNLLAWALSELPAGPARLGTIRVAWWDGVSDATVDGAAIALAGDGWRLFVLPIRPEYAEQEEQGGNPVPRWPPRAGS